MSRDGLIVLLYAAVTTALCVLTNCRANVLDGVLKAEKVPRTSKLMVEDGDEVTMTCAVRALCQACNPVIQFSLQNVSGAYLPVTDSHWKKLFFQRTCVYESSNLLSCSLFIPTYGSDYHGRYRCTWWESRNPNLNESHAYSLGPRQGEHGDQLEPLTCVLPEAKHIRAIPLFGEDEAVGMVTLTWDVTVREDDNLDPCQGGKNWKVRVSNYTDSNNIPEDFQPGKNAVYSDWENVHAEDTNHTLNLTFNKKTYYLFQVGHRQDQLGQSTAAYAEEFDSHVFYFGEQVGAEIEQSDASDVTTLTVGQSTEIKCVATGIPPPYVFFATGNFETNGSVATLSLNDVTEEDSGTYVCYASNDLVNPPTGKTLSVVAVRFKVNVEGKHPDPEGVYCEYLKKDYNGHCTDFLHLELMYFTNSSAASDREFTVGTILTEIDAIIIDKHCRSLAYAMVCNTLYAPCNPETGENSPRAICPSACEVFASGECSGLIRPEHTEVYPYISQCDQSGNHGGQLPECVPISLEAPRIDEFETIEDTGSCVRGNGRGYSGLRSVTSSGKNCQHWEFGYPHKHPMLPDIFRTDLKTPNSESSCRNPGGIGDRPWCYTLDPDTRWEYCDVPKCDECEDYRGSVCSSLPGYATRPVLVRKGGTISGQEELETDMSHLIDLVKYRYLLTEGCEDFLTTALCHATFPFCESGSEDQALKLCGDHCQLLENLDTFCHKAYVEYENYVSSHTALISSPECDLDTKADSRCISVPPPPGSTHDSPQNTTINCYTGQGRNYIGTVSHTVSGTPCLYWDSNKPRADFITAENYPELDGAENYCRNPGGLLTRPWCYAASGDKDWGYCEIPTCQQGQDLSLNAASEDTEEVPSEGSSAITILSVFLVIVITLLVVVVIVAVVMVHFRRRSSKKQHQQEPFRVTNIMSMEKYHSNPDYTLQESSVPSLPNDKVAIPDSFNHIDKEKITYVSQIGQGNFGVVFKGKGLGVVNGKDEVEVAVKTLKQEAAAEMVSSFVEEAKLMFSFDHPNILTIYGVCMDDFPYQMIFEYMDEGDLTQYLRSRASSTQRRILFPFSYHSRTESNFSNDPPSLSKTQLLYISEQISSGMAYLSAKHHVHRDLACRNCLIKKDLTVKIGDFGMSRNLYSRDYYRINGQAVLPVRWMSPEALIYGKFSIEGDVWSFGVVMWEIFSFALQPYYGISNEDVTEYIRKGRTLRQPDYCPLDVFKVMQECWNMEPNERPTFDELHKLLNELHSLASMSDDGKDETMSIDSDMPSDAFYSDGMSIDDDLA